MDWSRFLTYQLVMTFPAVFSATGSWFSALAGKLAALVLGWMEKGLLTVAAVACAVAFEAGFLPL